MPLESARSFCRSGHRDDRRRRLLTDELSNSDDWPAGQVESEDSPSPQKSEHYGDAEFLDRQWRLLDLVPRRWIALGGLLTAATAMIVGLGGRLRPDARARGGGRDARGRAADRRQRQPGLLVLVASCCWRRRSPRCWFTAFAGTGPTITEGDTACGSGPPAVGS